MKFKIGSQKSLPVTLLLETFTSDVKGYCRELPGGREHDMGVIILVMLNSYALL